jgi:hypothetical protein
MLGYIFTVVGIKRSVCSFAVVALIAMSLHFAISVHGNYFTLLHFIFNQRHALHFSHTVVLHSCFICMRDTKF